VTHRLPTLLGLFTSGLAIMLASGCGEDPHVALSAEQLLASGLEKTDRFDFEKAAPLYAAAAAKSTPDAVVWRQATYAHAVCLHQMTPPSAGNIAQATELYTSVTVKAPTSIEAANACLQLGRIAEQIDFHPEPVDLPLAREWYGKVVAGWANEPVAGEAVLALAGTWFQTMDQAEAQKGAILIEDWLAAHPKDPMAAVMWQTLGYASHQILNDRPRAIRAFLKAEALGFVSNGRQQVPLWTLSRLAELEGDRPLAIRCYTRMVEEFPTGGKGWEARERLIALGVNPPPLRRFSKAAETTEGVSK